MNTKYKVRVKTPSICAPITRVHERMSLQRVAVVTGSNKGIGFETAKKLAAAGLKTIICARHEERGIAAAKEATAFGDVIFRKLDISCVDSSNRFVEAFGKEFGRCDILVNCAGIAFKSADPTPSVQQARPTLETNYFGTSRFTLAMLPLLRHGSSPRIVTIASKSGQLRILPDEEKRRRITSPTMTVDEVSEFASEFIAAVENGTHVEQGWPDSNLGSLPSRTRTLVAPISSTQRASLPSPLSDQPSSPHTRCSASLRDQPSSHKS